MKDKFQHGPELRLQEYELTRPELPKVLEAGLNTNPEVTHDQMHGNIVDDRYAEAGNNIYKH